MSRWTDVESLFERLRDATPEERRTILDAEGDEGVVVDVSSLLEAHDGAGDFLERPAFEHPDAREERWTQELVDRGNIGPYRIIGVLGAGGMGVVLEARQEHPDRSVALKILRGASWSEDDREVRLFQREVEALARLDHPNIARIYDAGRTGDGQHWFTMELVRGLVFDEYVTEGSLPLRARLELFGRLCSAVAYAHRRGGIHCDLKPSNVLVADSGDGPHVKVLDFGLARVVREGQGSQQSMIEGMRGSLRWMSPEQTRVTDDRIDVRADVYALGVMLYELLTERVPYNLEGLAPLEAARIICESPPLAIGTSVPRDLATITRKALEKDAARRYEGASELGEDVRRWLAREPILARPPSPAYQMVRLVQRHKILFGSVLLIIGLSLAFAISASVQAARLQVERDAADHHARVVDRLIQWWGEKVLAAADPSRSPNPRITLAEVLRARARDIELDFADEPVVAARLHHMFARSWISIGLFPRASSHLVRALDLRRQHLGAEEMLTLSVMNDLATVFQKLGRTDAAEDLFREALSIRRRLLGPADHPLLLTSINNLGFLLNAQGRHEEARPLLEEAYERRRRSLGEGHEYTLSTKNNLAVMYIDLDQQEKAEPILQDVLSARQQRFAEHHPLVVRSVVNLARLRMLQGRHEDAGRLLSECRRVTTDVLGLDNLSTLEVMDAQALLHRYVGAIAEATKVGSEVVAARRRILGDRSPETLKSILKLAKLRHAARDGRGAALLYEEVIAGQRAVGRPEERVLLEGYQGLAVLCHDEGLFKRARRVCEEALEYFEEVLPAEHSNALMMRGFLGFILFDAGEHEEAEELLNGVVEAQRRVNGPGSERTLLTSQYLAQLYLKTSRVEEAERLARYVMDPRRSRRGLRNQHTMTAMRVFASSLFMQQRWAECREVLRELVGAMADVMPSVGDFRAVSLVDLANCEKELGELEAAEALFRRAHALIEGGEVHRSLDKGLQERLVMGLAETLDKLGREAEAAKWRAGQSDR